MPHSDPVPAAQVELAKPWIEVGHDNKNWKKVQCIGRNLLALVEHYFVINCYTLTFRHLERTWYAAYFLVNGMCVK